MALYAHLNAKFNNAWVYKNKVILTQVKTFSSYNIELDLSQSKQSYRPRFFSNCSNVLYVLQVTLKFNMINKYYRYNFHPRSKIPTLFL